MPWIKATPRMSGKFEFSMDDISMGKVYKTAEECMDSFGRFEKDASFGPLMKLLGKWLWVMCKMAKKKAKGRHGNFRHVLFLESRAYRKFVIRRFQREGYFPIGCPSFKFRSPEL